jgi:hypothetical protein
VHIANVSTANSCQPSFNIKQRQQHFNFQALRAP